ncbi:multidrug resistance protein, putative [Talaromyces stipitatus ATCC 10500]|uniref:Multidrug resistance protein, putative n=1 Tax=Talaromyces stipitatus (strain ATCC 10500 / CBS 375.48 / QM 6759 / NRRL 1006) TaxID=441959 RepID=B8M4D9_TALSN|nr:multidrug resistance protein, putative [Talaromyces stipitatus ATCC 10500]EED19134.1 multidrug resistance protein, putative [Talaromyces stipitatus ATCC 10500]
MRKGFRRVTTKNENIVQDAIFNNASQDYTTSISAPIAKLELICIFVDITIAILILIGSRESIDLSTIFASAVSSIYLLLLALVRQTPYFEIVKVLQTHSATLYTVQWVCIGVTGHALIFEGHGQLLTIATLTRFGIFTALCLFHWTASRVPVQASLNKKIPSSEPSREETASLISRLAFSWVNELVWRSFRATLEASDLYQLRQNQRSKVVSLRFHDIAATTIPLLRRLYRFLKYDLLRQGGWAAVNSVAVFIPPVLIKLILECIESPDRMALSTAWLCIGGLLVAGIIAGIADCQCDWIGHQMAAKLRTILINEIYEKVLRKRMTRQQSESQSSSTSEDHHASDGNIFNLMSMDAEHISLGVWLLYRLLGISGIVGVLCMIALLPLNFLISQRVMAVQARALKASDTRIQAGNEILNNIRTIKYSAWESAFKEQVMEKRRFEMTEMRSRFIWWSINATTFHSLPLIVTIITCFFYTIVWDNPLETSIAFPALAVFGIIRIPLDRLATCVTFVLQARVSLDRVDNFLCERETAKYDQLSKLKTSNDIGFEDATLAWPTEASANVSDDNGAKRGGHIPLNELASGRSFRLKSLDIRFRTEALNVICGPSGSGKSSLLLALLGEMDLIKGQVFLPHCEQTNLDTNNLLETTAYCPQEPWILNRTIRENIIFDFPFDSRRYECVLHAVALLPDIATMDNSDQTLCGENGSRLSGGQKQRVALARALYSPCKYVLLDDCLSAVDSHTANHIFSLAIRGSLMRDRTCILATHHTHLAIPHSDYVVMLDDGTVRGHGTAEELVSIGLIDAGVMESKWDLPSPVSFNINDIDFDVKLFARSSLESISLHEVTPKPEELEENRGYREIKAEGAVSWSVVRSYLGAMGSRWYWVAVLFMFAVQQFASLGTNLWIKEWAFQYDNLKRRTEASTPIQTTGDSETYYVDELHKLDVWYYITMYVILCASYTLITMLRDLITFYGSLKASSTIFERLLDLVLYAKLLFFDSVPLGQITNRFSKDVEVMDQSISGFSISALQLLASMATMIIFISTILPAFLVVAVFICVAYYFVVVVYINGARDLKRIESVQRSPLYQQFSETLAGVISIRAYARTSVFTAQNQELVDRLNQPYLLQWASKEWLTFRANVLSSMISFFTGAFVLWNSRRIEFGSAGLVLTYATNFTENVIWFVQVYAIIQQNLNSVDRIFEYKGIEQEATQPLRRAIYDMPEDWPSQGRIRFFDYTTRYAPGLEPGLKGISFEVRPGERVAVVGRTGAGKSTLTLALIRGLEADSGWIEIDGINISTVTLKQLRQAITLVPQDPELFDGTLRDNLDPLKQYTDEEIRATLHTVLLDDMIMTATKPSTAVSLLDFAADALSRGQRQLLCIARALLRQSRILVLDEATASIDYATDAAIQAGLRASVSNGTTVLTVAHRLQTIADYDKIIVLDAGRIVEQGSVRELLAYHRDGAIFRRMCEESGDLEGIERRPVILLHIVPDEVPPVKDKCVAVDCEYNQSRTLLIRLSADEVLINLYLYQHPRKVDLRRNQVYLRIIGSFVYAITSKLL